MSIPKYIERLALIVESLKKDILFEYSLSWTEYLVLCLVNQFEKKDIHPTPQEIIRTSGKNRGWIYRTIRKLDEVAYISVSEDKSFESGRIYITPLGRIILRSINTILVRRIREIQLNSSECIDEEDCIKSGAKH